MKNQGSSVGLNRTSFARLVSDNADLFDYVQTRSSGHLNIGRDLATGEFLSYAENEATSGDPAVEPTLKVLSGETVAISIPFRLLRSPLYDNWLYRITFSPASDTASAILADPSFEPFRRTRGYIGVTSRHSPFERFDEHRQKVRSGTGHLLHHAWAALTKLTDVKVQFHLVANVRTRMRAFDLEEELVDAMGTVAPGGLNVIPGGMKGVRELWRLGLMARNAKLNDGNIDRALTLLESERSPVAAHYRRGHIRQLATRTTWVSPCWVAMKDLGNGQ